jgi:nitrogen regulatory protein P-II 1
MVLEKSQRMTKVQAIVREQQVEAIVERLVLIGVRGLTLGTVKGTGPGSSHREVFRGSAYRVDYAPRVLIEWYGPDREAEAIVRVIQQRGATGEIGDGEIFVQPIDDAIRIRTGERGLDAV